MLLVILIACLLLVPPLQSLGPTVSSDPPSLSVSAGDQLTLNCSHNQSEAVFWTTDSGAILPSQHFNLSNQLIASYVIPSADPSLNGSTFQCVANKTNATQLITSVTLEVLYLEQNLSVTLLASSVRIGETIFLSCLPVAWPPATVEWQLNGATVGSTNQLSVPVTSHAVAGEYTCTATNSEGSVSASAVVSVTADQSTFFLYRNASSPVSLSCRGSGISWSQNGSPLVPLPDGISIDVTPHSSVLRIAFLNSSLVANYSCFLTDSGVTNSVFVLDIPTLQDAFSLSPPSRGVFPTETVELPCAAPPGDPEPILSWYRFGYPTALSNASIPGVSLLTNGFLRIESFSQSDAGVYSCVAHSLAGFRLSSANLSILPTPQATILLANSPAVSPSTFSGLITLSCNLSAVGVFRFRWRRDGQVVGRERHLNVSLSGEYRCEVEIATSLDSLLVRSDPLLLVRNSSLSFRDRIGDRLVAEGDTLSVTCDTVGEPDPVYLWFFGNEEIRNSTRAVVWRNILTLFRVTQETAGLYQCHVLAQSDSRAIKQTFRLLVRFGPFVWTPLSSVTLVEGDAGILECDADGSPSPIVHWSRVSPNAPDALSNSTLRNGTLLLSPITLSHAGRYLCTATDPTNSSNFRSSPVDLTVLPSSPLLPSPSTPPLPLLLVPLCVALSLSLLLACCVVCSSLLLRRSCSRNRSLHLRKLETGSPSRLRNKLSPKQQYLPLGASQLSHMSPVPSGHQKPELKFPLIGFPRDELSFGLRLGDGAYGPIIEGTIEEFLGQRRHVAVECYISKSDEGSFPKPDELHTWPVFFLYHDNLSRVLGICTTVEPYYVIYEYSDRGCLKEFLRTYREQMGTATNTPSKGQSGVDVRLLLTQALLLRMCRQAALGLEFLAQNDMVFRDVASRNCCVSSSLDIKLINLPIGPNLFPGDYFRRDKEFVPARWMSPESLQSSQFTTKSDVWAFGVFCWEVFTYARQPYETLSDELVLDRVPQGLRLSEPEEGCPEGAYRLMSQCWAQNPDKRPSFSTLCVNLNDVSCD